MVVLGTERGRVGTGVSPVQAGVDRVLRDAVKLHDH